MLHFELEMTLLALLVSAEGLEVVLEHYRVHALFVKEHVDPLLYGFQIATSAVVGFVSPSTVLLNHTACGR